MDTIARIPDKMDENPRYQPPSLTFERTPPRNADLVCFLCKSPIDVDDGSTYDRLDSLAGKDVAFIVCSDCLNDLLFKPDQTPANGNIRPNSGLHNW